MGEPRRSFIARHFGPAKAAAFEVEPGPLGWLISLWLDAGQVRLEMGPMGGVLVGLDWRDIHAWVEAAQEHDLAPLYRRGIMALSAAYAQTAMAASDVECEAPFDPAKG